MHLLAELLDNATYFSEPETKISVRAVVTRKRALAIQITDRGVGMTEEQLAKANARLADPPDLDVSVTRRMGLYVVARLAKRHGIEVRLRENEDIEGGVIARIVVPAELLTQQPQTPQPAAMPRMAGHHNGSFAGVPAAAELPMRRLDQPEEPAADASPRVSEPDTVDSARTSALPRPNIEAGAPADNAGLKPLEQPISLDDLVGGAAKAAGPFVSPASAEPPLPDRGGTAVAGRIARTARRRRRVR
ncbi:sensor histidine kinase [Prauserella oleivorans]